MRIKKHFCHGVMIASMGLSLLCPSSLLEAKDPVWRRRVCGALTKESIRWCA